jgi:NitT/TauT family transport system substrate-binding protein
MKKRWFLWIAAAGTAALVVGLGSAVAASRQATLTNVTLQLKWVPQAQFAGYYAAVKQGFYVKEGLNVTLKNGGPDIIPEQVVASGQAQFGVDWVPSLLAARDKGTNLVNIAQVFARSGMTQLTWKSSGINTIAKMQGKKVANWLGGNQWELFAALQKDGINPNNPKDVTIVQQPFDMNLFLQHKVDSASAMTYNELAQVLESGVKMSQLNVIKMQNVGTGMLEDGLFSTQSYTSNPANSKTIVAFIKGSLEGWIYCRDHMAACVQDTLDYGPTLPKGHQTWMMNEINKLIWPNTAGIGVMDKSAYQRTATISKQFKVIAKAPTAGAYTTKFATQAVAELKQAGVDVYGKGWKAPTVPISPGGK